MRVIEVQSFGGPEVLKIAEKKIPEATEGSVVIRVMAVGVNPVETYIRAGTYPVLPELPYVPGGNCAGVVERVGRGASKFKAGDRVYTSSGNGAYGEYCLCDEKAAYPLPENVSFEAGAAVGVPAATAYRALFIRGEGKAGGKVLIHGASGSVGLAAVQLAKAAGMVVTGTAGTERGLELITKLGADRALLHHGDYVKMLAEEAAGGFDLILEMLANVNLEKDLQLLASKGRVVIIGSRGRIEIDPRATMGKETDIRGLALASSSAEELERTHSALYKALANGVLTPVISCKLPLAEAAKAHDLVMESGNCGKIILLP